MLAGPDVQTSSHDHRIQTPITASAILYPPPGKPFGMAILEAAALAC